MIERIMGEKIGMTQVFVGEKAIPVTAINLGTWFVTGLKTQERDGYVAVQVGSLRDKYASKEFQSDWLKSLKTHFRYIKEIRMEQPDDTLQIGQVLDFRNYVAQGDTVHVKGSSRGRGFQGCVKRHGFGGFGASHGSTMMRRPGSVGFMRSQGRIIKGKRFPGQMGVEASVVKNLEVIQIQTDAPVILVKGSVPGHSGSFVVISKA